MQREEFLQQLKQDFIHCYPELGVLPLWELSQTPEYLSFVTVNYGPFAAEYLIPVMLRMGYRQISRHAMADRGLLVIVLAPPDDGTWLLLAELQLGALLKEPRNALIAHIDYAASQGNQAPSMLYAERAWPMPNRDIFRRLEKAHRLAAWLAVKGPCIHHIGFDCGRLSYSLSKLDGLLKKEKIQADDNCHHGILPVSSLLKYRFYSSHCKRLVFTGGEDYRLSLGGVALMQKCLVSSSTRAVQLLLPHHTRCTILRK